MTNILGLLLRLWVAGALLLGAGLMFFLLFPIHAALVMYKTVKRG